MGGGGGVYPRRSLDPSRVTVPRGEDGFFTCVAIGLKAAESLSAPISNAILKMCPHAPLNHALKMPEVLAMTMIFLRV